MSVSRKIDKLLQESRISSQVVGALTGLGGVYTGGAFNGSFNAYKKGIATKDLKRAQGEVGAATASDNVGAQVGHTLAGALPIIGSIANVKAASDRWDKLDLLNAERAKKGLPPVS